MFISEKHKKRVVAVRGTLVVGGLAALLTGITGCGGTKVNGNTLNGIKPAPPAAYGLEALTAVNASDNTGLLESSGLSSPDGTVAYATGAVDSTAVPQFGLVAANGKIPLGFSPGAQYVDSKLYGGVVSGTSVVFRVALSNGQNGTTTIPINPSSVIVSSPDLPTPLGLTFNAAGTNGPLANALYGTAPFTVPAGTGLHTYKVAVADTSGQSSTTTYAVPVVDPGTSGVLAQVVDTTMKNAPIPGAVATITNPISGATSQATADAQGMIVLFAAPGAQTITVGTKTTNVTLTAGQLLDTTTDAKANVSVLTVPGA